MGMFRKKATEHKINEETIHIQPLGMGIIMELKALGNPIAVAISKLKTIGVQDFEEYTHSIPKPTEDDKDALELTKKVSHSAPSMESIDKVLGNREEGIKALFDILFREDLIGRILISSVVELKDIDPKELFIVGHENCMDMPTLIEIFGIIVDVNVGGFKSLGKSWLPLIDTLKEVGAKL